MYVLLTIVLGATGVRSYITSTCNYMSDFRTSMYVMFTIVLGATCVRSYITSDYMSTEPRCM